MTHSSIHSPNAASAVAPPTSGELSAAFAQLRDAYQKASYPSYGERRALLDGLLEASLRHKDEIAEAASQDWGYRCRVDSLLGDVFPTVQAIKFVRSELKNWMKPQRRPTSYLYRPAYNRVHLQPLGVVGIIGPWNYPFQLCMEPLVYAIAAGNRVMVKPSEFTPHSAALLKRILSDVLGPRFAYVAEGGVEVAEAFTELPFDHLLFTGSTRVGKIVAKAAAERLVPVTLELGGKSPVLVHPDYPLQRAADSIAGSKCFNAGQTCIAPDYVLTRSDQIEPLAAELRKAIARRYPKIGDNVDYSAIANDGHYQRLRGLVESAVAAGATAIEIKGAEEILEPASRKLPPTLLTNVTDEMSVMQEEIFGPVLPLVPYERLDQALAYINQRPRPLAFYYFDQDNDRVQHVLRSTLSGGACVNECLLHFAQDHIPFGGVGPSGMGAYHGREGFETFSHKRGVFYQSRFNLTWLQAPPFGARMDRLLNMLLR